MGGGGGGAATSMGDGHGRRRVTGNGERGSLRARGEEAGDDDSDDHYRKSANLFLFSIA